MKKSIIITNNPLVYEKFKDKRKVEYYEEKTYLEILEYIRGLIHKGHSLLTHPLSGSIKPNETPYKSIIIGAEEGELDKDGLLIMEDAIATAKLFQKNMKTPLWTESILDDFRVIDLSLMENTIEILGH